MADYYPLMAKSVAKLDKSTGEARRALYDRARTALLANLRGVTPSLTESEITRERLALEEAIRKVEAEEARRLRTDPPPRRSPTPAEMDEMSSRHFLEAVLELQKEMASPKPKGSGSAETGIEIRPEEMQSWGPSPRARSAPPPRPESPTDPTRASNRLTNSEWSWERYLELGQTAARIIRPLTFFGAYIYCIATYGFLLGFGFGWIPSAILALITGVLAQLLWLPMLVLLFIAVAFFGAIISR